MKQKLAIISSYNELCGNATYTEVLRKEFMKYYDVEVLPLKVKWLNSHSKKLKKLADQHIEEIARKLLDYDCVNIQFEAGLYGTHPSDIVRRIKTLSRNAKNLVFTMHRVDVSQSILDKNFLKNVLITGTMNSLKSIWRENYFARLYEEIVKFLKDESKYKNIRIIVHTKRDLETIRYLFGFDQVYDYPLSFLNQKELKYYQENSDRTDFCKTYNLDVKCKTIGCFGFLADYKAHETVILAAELLPPNYKVLIFGSQHPMSITPYQTINPYLQKLISLVNQLDGHGKSKGKAKGKSKSLMDSKVWFLGNLDDESFIKALHCCDFTVLPYLEVNQGGSGIASLAIETKAKALFSNNFAFAELKRYFPDCFVSFDIGNYRELAYKILNYNYDFRNNIERCMQTYNIENNVLFYKRLFDMQIGE